MRNTILASFALVALAAWSLAAPQDNRDAHVMLMVFEPGPHGIPRQSEFSKQAKPGVGKEFKMRIESSVPCHAVVAAFNREERMAYDGSPSEFVVKGHSVSQFPATGGSKWTWDGQENLAEMDIILISGAPPGELSRLMEAMRDASVAEAVRKRQASELRRWIDQHSQNASTASDYSMKSSPEVIGGILRGDGCDWCKSAQKVSIPANGFAIVRIHID